MSVRTFSLTIPSGQALSNEQHMNEDGYRGPLTITVIAPVTLAETVTLQICGPLLNFVDQQSNGADITFPAGKATTVIIANATLIRLKANTGVGGDRAFEVLWNVVTERG